MESVVGSDGRDCLHTSSLLRVAARGVALCHLGACSALLHSPVATRCIRSSLCSGLLSSLLISSVRFLDLHRSSDLCGAIGE